MQQSGRHNAISIAFAIALLSPAVVSAIGPPWSPDQIRKAVQRHELVVHGVIDSITLGSCPEHGKEYPSTVVQLHVSEVLKGTWGKSELRAVLLGTRDGAFEDVTYDYEIGEEVILCLSFDPDAMGGVYRFYSDWQSFVKRSGSWTTRDRQLVSLDAINEAARQTDPEVMASEADAVLVGFIHDVHLQEFDCGFPIQCTADYASVVVSDGLKGFSEGDSLLVRVLRRGSNLDWYEPVPSLRVGKSYVMFLKKDAVGFYPFRGFNGFLEVRGEDLILNDHVRYSLTRTEALTTARRALKR